MSTPPSLPLGLPPLPKSLTGVASPRGGEHLSQKSVASFGALKEHIINTTNSCVNQHESGLSSTQDSISDRDSVHSRASSSLSAHDMPTSTNTLDTQIALLRREMYSLRQLDLSLLSQLWALNESIQSFRTVLQDREDVTPSPTPSNTNSISSDGEQDDQSFSPLPPASSIPIAAGNGSSASTSTSASNSLSAVSNTAIAYSVQAGTTSKHIPLNRVWSQQSGRMSHVQQSERWTCSQQNFVKTPHPKYLDMNERSQPCEDGSQSQMSDSSARSKTILVGRSHSNESGGRRTHPQLPSILQQRMRRPPPPPPPSRSSTKSPNRTQEQQLTV